MLCADLSSNHIDDVSTCAHNNIGHTLTEQQRGQLLHDVVLSTFRTCKNMLPVVQEYEHLEYSRHNPSPHDLFTGPFDVHMQSDDNV